MTRPKATADRTSVGEGFSDALRRELQGFGIRVITIAPSMVCTPIWNAIAGKRGTCAGTHGRHSVNADR
ncbi:hypothetical protein CCR97_02115 [Rhodoplanes elegans]|uniref:Uncharacterized protein n=1 Tax=Rhodoplanes elegans TaxID=29408 RepID=A0A327KF99_9BRAD|nr:hypothetical protein [Rhodoplanes elegans]RAI36766.1 hypothetical protein CH338_17125 [Rhodoplanes elegans]